MTPEVAEAWLRVAARSVITAAFLGAGLWMVAGQQTVWCYSFITFIAGYWLK